MYERKRRQRDHTASHSRKKSPLLEALPAALPAHDLGGVVVEPRHTAAADRLVALGAAAVLETLRAAGVLALVAAEGGEIAAAHARRFHFWFEG